MATAPYSIEIFVPDGDPEGVRVVSLKNWTGVGVVFPRRQWVDTKRRREFDKTGVYILSGYAADDEDLPLIYIGQTDELRKRIEQHHRAKDFWDFGVVFVSTNDFLNRAHVTWLEWALYDRAARARRCAFDNNQVPQEPSLSEAERADMEAFLAQMLQVFPLIGTRVFEEPKAISVPGAVEPTGESRRDRAKWDTIVVPAKREGFERVFLGEDAWYAIRIGGGMVDQLKYIAAYQTNPTSAITHVAPIERIEPYGDSGKYKVVFAAPAKEIAPIPYGDAPSGAMQGPRYTSRDALDKAKTLVDLLF